MSRLSQKQRDNNFFYKKRGDVSYPCKRIVTCTGGRIYQGAEQDPRSSSRTFQWTNYRTTSANIPDWKQRVADGRDATTYLEGFRRELNVQPSGFVRSGDGGAPWSDYRWTTGPAHIFSGHIPAGGIETFDATLDVQATSKAKHNFIQSYKKARSTWQAGVFAGEAAIMVKSLVSPGKSLAKAGEKLVDRTRKLLSGKASDSQYLSAATDSWLAYQYVAKPLASDMKQAMDHYNSQAARLKGRVVRIYGSEQLVSNGAGVFTIGHLDASGTGSSVWVKQQTQFSVRIRGAYRSKMNAEKLLDWDALGLAPEDWGPTVYEIIPFSFLADYFSNLGEVVDSAAFAMVDLAWANMTKRQEHTISVGPMFGPVSTSNQTFPYDYSYGGRVLDKHTRVSRTHVLFDFDYGKSFRLELPGLKQGLNIAALVNSLTTLAR